MELILIGKDTVNNIVLPRIIIVLGVQHVKERGMNHLLPLLMGMEMYLILLDFVGHATAETVSHEFNWTTYVRRRIYCYCSAIYTIIHNFKSSESLIIKTNINHLILNILAG